MKAIQITFGEELLARRIRHSIAERYRNAYGSVVNLDHVQTVEQARLETFIGRLEPQTMTQVCRALAIATGCAGS